MPYRSLFAVLTWDSVLVYDTYHSQPLTMIRGLHYCNLVDATWSADGHSLLVCSTDGYISIISFDKGELGEVYTKPVEVTEVVSENTRPVMPAAQQQVVVQNDAKDVVIAPPPTVRLPPCEAGPAVLAGPPAKRLKTSNEQPQLPMDQLTLEAPAVRTLEPVRKKKRVQPVLLSTIGFN
jgi:hypothetical protein